MILWPNTCKLYSILLLFDLVHENIKIVRAEPVFKIIVWKIPIVPYRVDLCASRLTESTRSMDTVQYSWNRDGFPKIFFLKSTLHEKSYYKKEEDIPYSFASVSVQNIWEMDTQGYTRSRLAKILCHPKQCWWIRLKSVPHFFVLNTGSGVPFVGQLDFMKIHAATQRMKDGRFTVILS